MLSEIIERDGHQVHEFDRRVLGHIQLQRTHTMPEIDLDTVKGDHVCDGAVTVNGRTSIDRDPLKVVHFNLPDFLS